MARITRRLPSRSAQAIHVDDTATSPPHLPRTSGQGHDTSQRAGQLRGGGGGSDPKAAPRRPCSRRSRGCARRRSTLPLRARGGRRTRDDAPRSRRATTRVDRRGDRARRPHGACARARAARACGRATRHATPDGGPADYPPPRRTTPTRTRWIAANASVAATDVADAPGGAMMHNGDVTIQTAALAPRRTNTRGRRADGGRKE